MKNYLKTIQFTRQISLGILSYGGVHFLNHWPYAISLLSVGGLGFAIYCFLSAFKPIHEEPNWELVYPELALGNVEELDLETQNDENHENRK